MRLAPFIAVRYLFARKSHNVINIISAISAIGMAVGTAALIIILSVYNGFDSLIRSMMSTVEPDLLITPSSGKVFVPEGDVYDWIYDRPEVLSMCCILEDNVFISYDGSQGLAKAKGVDWIYAEESPLADHIRNGEFSLYKGDIPQSVVGGALAYEMGINPRFLSPIEMYYPSRTKSISIADPRSALESVKVFPSGVFTINEEIDSELMIVPIEVMRDLLKYDDEVSAIEIRVAEGTERRVLKDLQEEISRRLGDGFEVKDRYRQNEVLYKMMTYEKLATYLILIFVIIIIAFNIFGSLTMLIIEKEDDIRILRSMGATRKLISRVFVLEGWMISLAGLAVGTFIGTALSLIQQHFGIIKMPGLYVVQAYPILLSWADIAITAAGVAIIGYIIAVLPVMTRSRRWEE